ncbi:MAG: lipid-A-disaccharide synthase [Phycisphaerae bacterium]|nr:lipid-A-disaccharide synthase [Phycisphaerae bacterium]
MRGDPPTIFLSAAEASGDHHAAGLIHALRRRFPDAKFLGAAGPEMSAAGCESILDLTQKASMVAGPLANLRYYHRAVKQLQRAIREIHPDVFVPVDSPALNWHLAKAAKAVGTPVMYYVAPQVWAWARWRIKKVRRLTDHVACILPFEEAYFRQRGVAATYVGHPLFDSLPAQRQAGDCPDLIDAWRTGQWRVALLPGSRPGEIKRHAPALANTAEAIRRRWPEAKCTFTAVNARAVEQIRTHAGRDDLDIVAGQTETVLSEAHFAVAASGTVTLSVAHFGVPMVILHRVGMFERILFRLLGRRLIHTKHLSLVNILAGRRIVPELMPWYGSEKQLLDAVMLCMDDIGWLTTTRRKLLDLTRPLPAANHRSAAENTADIVAEMMGKKKT